MGATLLHRRPAPRSRTDKTFPGSAHLRGDWSREVLPSLNDQDWTTAGAVWVVMAADGVPQLLPACVLNSVARRYAPCDDRAVTKLKTVGLQGTELWAYDASLSLVLAQTVRLVEESSPDRRPAWWSGVVRELRVHAVVTEFYLDLDLGLDAGQREELAQLFDEAAELVRERGLFTADEAAAWPILDDTPVKFRGREPEPTAPAAELGHALAQVIRGTLPPAPTGTWWFYGPPGGRRTIRMPGHRESS